ncbi:MAG: SDR family NAD(P)-dependent oxidoreductase [Chloroflexi bacterium]|nr:SDR family NAD(P)-dependent oxidoreductase [Chloroflexota bacterium]MDA1240299.1 SDR family NAD(P)-dependent oxidoreductase [Chloroflexota bacterium]
MPMQANKNGVLAGRVAVVTGASRGIGEAIAVRYAMEGAKVVVSARTMNDGENPMEGSLSGVVENIRAAGGEATAIRCDLSNGESRVALIEETKKVYGNVDILVNNAAVTFFIPVLDFPERRFRLMQEVQVYAPFHLAQMVLPGMKERGAGWIVNVSSGAARHPAADAGARGGAVYGMCKAALERFTTGLASEVYADNIAVNVISPGLVATPGTVHHKLVREDTKERETPVEHMAEACLKLVAGDPKALTGRIDYAYDMMKEFSLTAADLPLQPLTR